jgi:hypothetical protein
MEEIENSVVIVFGVYMDRLILVNHEKSGKVLTFSIYDPFKDALDVIGKLWNEYKFDRILIQDPKSVSPACVDYYDYNLLPRPPANEIEEKGILSEKFYKYLRNRLDNLFPGVELLIEPVTVESFITDASTGKLLPPIGLSSDISGLQEIGAVQIRNDKYSRIVLSLT